MLVRLTPSHRMALTSILSAYLLQPDATLEFVDVVASANGDPHTTTVAELLQLFMSADRPPARPPNVVTQLELDNVVARHCDVPGCDHTTHELGLDLGGRCHPGAPMFVTYRDRVLTLRCALCRSAITQVLVGTGEGV